MDYFFGLLSHLMIILGVVAQFYSIFYVIKHTEDSTEKIVRITAFTTGLLIFFGSKALNFSLSDLILLGIKEYNPMRFGFFGVFIPSSLGYILAWYFIRQMKNSASQALRIMILIGVFTILQFSDIYLKVININGIPLNRTMIPNLTFTIAIGLYVTLKYEIKK